LYLTFAGFSDSDLADLITRVGEKSPNGWAEFLKLLQLKFLNFCILHLFRRYCHSVSGQRAHDTFYRRQRSQIVVAANATVNGAEFKLPLRYCRMVLGQHTAGFVRQ
jgi:hypothetical protein